MRFRRLAVALGAAGLLASVSAAPSLAATTSPYSANFPQEKTIQRTCPPGIPAGAFCFTGSDHSGLGTSTPPGSTATEDFAGYVDFSQPLPGACAGGATGFPDHNVVSIGTSSGNLFMRTDGTDCMNTGTDDGTWVILGGTGVFSDASGTGHVHTQATGGTGTPTNPITSFSAYTGTITLR